MLRYDTASHAEQDSLFDGEVLSGEFDNPAKLSARQHGIFDGRKLFQRLAELVVFGAHGQQRGDDAVLPDSERAKQQHILIDSVPVDTALRAAEDNRMIERGETPFRDR